jgi:CBS domain-containing protein
MATPPIAPSLLAATVADLRRHAPFSEMRASELEWLASRLQLTYFAAGSEALKPEDGPPKWFYLIKQGTMEAGRAGESGVLQLQEGECFPLGALLSKRAVSHHYRAAQDTFCYLLPGADFHALLEISPAFRDFCTRRIASLLEQSQKALQAEYALREEAETPFIRPLQSLISRAPVTARPDTALADALASMSREKVGSVAVIDQDQAPVGILTLRDVLDRVVLPGLPLHTPVQRVMTPHPVTLPATAFASEALLALAQRSIHHLLITADGKLSGVISEKDLFALRRLSVQGVSAALQQATSVDELARIAPDIQALAQNLIAQGLEAEVLTQTLSALNDQLSRRAIELETRDLELPSLRWCWMALGSEGRREQTLATDQDNALIFQSNQPAEAIRAILLPIAGRINAALAACGFPLCRGEIMASNPKWCLSLEEWRATFANWIQRGDNPSLLHATIFFDFRPLHGATELCDELRTWLDGHVRQNRLFLRFMAENALANRPPLGLVRDFVVAAGGAQANTLDLKLNGVTPFVDAARIFALYAGVSESGTVARLRAAARAWNIPVPEVEAWIAAFHFIQLLRLRRQHQAQTRGEAASNRIDPEQLNELDRRILKEAFRQARKLQARMGSYFEF